VEREQGAEATQAGDLGEVSAGGGDADEDGDRHGRTLRGDIQGVADHVVIVGSIAVWFDGSTVRIALIPRWSLRSAARSRRACASRARGPRGFVAGK
jgi:hypothetical protein